MLAGLECLGNEISNFNFMIRAIKRCKPEPCWRELVASVREVGSRTALTATFLSDRACNTQNVKGLRLLRAEADEAFAAGLRNVTFHVLQIPDTDVEKTPNKTALSVFD